MITLIACISNNNGIGLKNQLLYHIPEDMKHFREMTLGKMVVMGRKTFESLSNGPLPGRINIVLSKNKNWEYNGVIKVNDINVFKMLTDDIYIIGGEEIYNQFISMADSLELTIVDDITPADSWFPQISEEWIIEKKSKKILDLASGKTFQFIKYTKE